jgi:hypothetical protein
MTIDTFIVNDVELINEGSLEGLEAFASLVSINPYVRWIKFVLLDDQPNKNKQRIPKEEFDNVLKTGMYMPLKSEAGTLSGDHKDSGPLGVITNLTKEGNRVLGLAALWERERPEDIKLLKESFASGNKINISWELTYNEKIPQDGYTDLVGISLNAATIVGMPAYAGRTPIVALASTENNGTEENSSEIVVGVSEMEDKLNELETITKERDDALEVNKTLTEEITSLKTSLTQKDSDMESMRQELASLKEFKSSIDAEKERVTKLDNLKKLFSESGLEVTEDYFADAERVNKLLSMDESAINFLIQETVSFKKAAEASVEGSVKVPKLGSNSHLSTKSPAEIGRALRQAESKENK